MLARKGWLYDVCALGARRGPGAPKHPVRRGWKFLLSRMSSRTAFYEKNTKQQIAKLYKIISNTLWHVTKYSSLNSGTQTDFKVKKLVLVKSTELQFILK